MKWLFLMITLWQAPVSYQPLQSPTVIENILLGLDDPKFVMNIHKYEKQVRALGKENNLEVDPAAFIWQLTVGEQQRVEILKMLYRGCDILIMDEPTAVLAPQEIEVLFNTLRTMTANGKSIIFISHKLNEILEIADRVTVLRHGKITAEDVSTRDITREDLVVRADGCAYGRSLSWQRELRRDTG